MFEKAEALDKDEELGVPPAVAVLASCASVECKLGESRAGRRKLRLVCHWPSLSIFVALCVSVKFAPRCPPLLWGVEPSVYGDDCVWLKLRVRPLLLKLVARLLLLKRRLGQRLVE